MFDEIAVVASTGWCFSLRNLAARICPYHHMNKAGPYGGVFEWLSDCQDAGQPSRISFWTKGHRHRDQHEKEDLTRKWYVRDTFSVDNLQIDDERNRNLFRTTFDQITPRMVLLFFEAMYGIILGLLLPDH
nr:hypothetical protein CFP56_31778 [Quercus suber]